MIFLHSSFRTSSTWLQSRFRGSDRTICYNEVFNERLDVIQRAQLKSLKYDVWCSKHPVDAGYFLEFLPLVRDGGGVESFEAAMAFKLFIPPGGFTGEISEREQTYLAGLIAYADALGKIPVLSETRTLGRLPAIKAKFPGLHILICRNLFQQWCSYTEQLFLGNSYFLDTIRRIIEESQHDLFCRYLHDLFPLEKPALDSTNYFCCFVLLHLYLYAQVADAADLIIDINRLSIDAAYRCEIERKIGSAGVVVDLSDVRESVAYSFVTLDTRKELASELKVIADLVISAAPSQQGREFAFRALADFVAECRRYQFYAGPLAAVAGPGGLLGERDCLRLERDNLAAERDRLRAKRAALLNSPSWRITRPFRALPKLFRRKAGRLFAPRP